MCTGSLLKVVFSRIQLVMSVKVEWSRCKSLFCIRRITRGLRQPWCALVLPMIPSTLLISECLVGGGIQRSRETCARGFRGGAFAAEPEKNRSCTAATLVYIFANSRREGSRCRLGVGQRLIMAIFGLEFSISPRVEAVKRARTQLGVA